MANSLSAEVWLDQRRWDALEEALKAQGSDIEQHLQDYLISLYNEMVPQEQWEQVEKRISNEAAETAREAEEHTVYTVFHVREHGHDSIFSTGNGEEFLDVAIAVETSMMMNVLAAGMEISEEDLRQLRARCVREVKQTNGNISLKDAVKYQKGQE